MDKKNMKNFLVKFQTTIIIFVIIILTLALDRLVLLLNKIPLLSIPGVASLSDKILFATFLALLWYARETKEMRKETMKQTDFEMRPYLRLQWLENNTNNEIFQIVNDGRGVAVNVIFKKFKIGDKFISIKNRPVISSKGWSNINLEEFKGNEEYIVQNINKETEIIVNYKDLENHKYKVIFSYDESYNDKFKIKFQGLEKKP